LVGVVHGWTGCLSASVDTPLLRERALHDAGASAIVFCNVLGTTKLVGVAHLSVLKIYLFIFARAFCHNFIGFFLIFRLPFQQTRLQ
jgi:hypothetical protein